VAARPPAGRGSMTGHPVTSLATPRPRPDDASATPEAATTYGDALWVAFRTTYAAALLDARQEGIVRDPVADYAVQLSMAPGETPPRTAGRTSRPAHLEGRGRQLATKLVVAFATESGGLPGCLGRAERWGGFDWLRDRLEDHGFPRGLAWRLCVAFRRARLLHAQPNRPYLDRPGVELAQRLLGKMGVRARSVRDWEAALMLEADSRLASGAHPATLDAETVTAACARLAGKRSRR
jgi:hypothetical protein